MSTPRRRTAAPASRHAPSAEGAGAPHAEPASAPSAFEALGLSGPLLRSLSEEGYTEPTPVQTEAIPHAVAGRDLLATARTGTGKTAAFLLPLLERLGAEAAGKTLRILVVSPTRELAAQIAERAEAYGRHTGLRQAVIYGGVSQRGQERALRRKPALLVATPGRLLDLMEQRLVHLDTVDMVVLDEADRMLDMGFLPAVRRIVRALPEQRQTLFFSATMPADIARLVETILRDPVRVSVDEPEETPTELDQSIHFVPKAHKRALLQKLLGADDMERALVFTRTKRGANRLAEQLARNGVGANAIHGNKSQNAREAALDGFRRGTTPVLVATDVAARGIDVKGISHVVNYDLPETPESYVHRIGRTGRAGARGMAISLCDAAERGLLFDIERHLDQRIPVASGGTAQDAELEAKPARPSSASRPSTTVRRRSGRGGGGGGRGRRRRP